MWLKGIQCMHSVFLQQLLVIQLHGYSHVFTEKIHGYYCSPKSQSILYCTKIILWLSIQGSQVWEKKITVKDRVLREELVGWTERKMKRNQRTLFSPLLSCSSPSTYTTPGHQIPFLRLLPHLQGEFITPWSSHHAQLTPCRIRQCAYFQALVQANTYLQKTWGPS